MNNLIERQAAIDKAIMIPVARIVPEDKVIWRKAVFVEDIEKLPSVDAAPVKPGKWIYGEDKYGIDGYHCDECGFFVPWDYVHKFINYIEDYNFCPHCGADMRKGEDDHDDCPDSLYHRPHRHCRACRCRVL